MREIKFRAWDTIENVMVFPEKITNPVMSEAPDEINCFILMQFTGLKDETGKEIYEGDFLKARYAPNYKEKTFVVKWNDGSASFVCYREHENPKVQFEQLPLCPSNSMENLEVVGNIYETPNLGSGRHEA